MLDLPQGLYQGKFKDTHLHANEKHISVLMHALEFTYQRHLALGEAFADCGAELAEIVTEDRISLLRTPDTSNEEYMCACVRYDGTCMLIAL
jgi:hypothetical protein